MKLTKNRWVRSILALLLAGLLAAGLVGCATGSQSGSESPSAGSVPLSASSDDISDNTMAASDVASAGLPASAAEGSATQPPAKPACFFDELADGIIAGLGLGEDADDTEKVLAAYRYVIARTVYIEFDDERLTESWRYADRCGRAPTIYQTTALGPLYYGIGTCEHFSAALMVLLERMGYQTLYVAGRTWSYDGRLVDHAWVMVCLEDVWYHIDPQLEDNVIRDGRIEYRYFLKGDADFLAHHVWGSGLPAPDEHGLALPACPQSAPALEAGTLQQDPAPDMNALLARADRMKQAAGQPPTRLAPVGELPPLPRYLEGGAL